MSSPHLPSIAPESIACVIEQPLTRHAASSLDLEHDINAIDAIIDIMASITIRDLDPALKERLRVRAAQHGRSMEEEARVILRSVIAAGSATPSRLADSIRQRFGEVGPVDLELPPREPMREPPKPR